MHRQTIYVSSLCLWAVSALAQEAGGPAAPWSGSAELGASSTSGNTDTRSVNAKAEVLYKLDRWRHTLNGEVLFASDSGEDTAERYVAAYQADAKLSPRSYLYGAVRGEVDKFSGYDYRLSEALGYGYRLWAAGDLGYLELEGGPGMRQSQPEEGAREDEAILRLAAKYRHSWTATTRFSQDFLVESGEDNTYVESVTGLKVRINSALAMKLSFTAKRNSEVPAGTKKTDTLSAVNLVYDF
jgi:putative salt-induced outer membrane protein